MKSFVCQGQNLVLHPSRVIFWENQSALILSDLHFGKTGHFRKSGIAVPQNVYKEDLQRLVTLVQYFNPKMLIIAGDLFHSNMNQELELFKRWRNDLSSIDMHLVKGNHDILHDKWYDDSAIQVHKKNLQLETFLFCHDATDCEEHQQAGELYSFTGHVHPGVSISGMGRQSLRFPCFYFTPTYCILPAFSHFTGTYRIHPGDNDAVFAIVDQQIIQFN